LIPDKSVSRFFSGLIRIDAEQETVYPVERQAKHFPALVGLALRG
jgi:hypothetical protein